MPPTLERRESRRRNRAVAGDLGRDFHSGILGFKFDADVRCNDRSDLCRRQPAAVAVLRPPAVATMRLAGRRHHNAWRLAHNVPVVEQRRIPQ